MIEGIIQKVCRGYDSEIAVAIELELIEEIKQELDNEIKGYGRWNVIINMREKLIGDTKQ